MKITLSFGLAFLLTILIAFAANLNVSPDPVIIQGQSDTIASTTFTITNTGTTSVNLSYSSFNISQFIDSNGHISTISFTSPDTIAAGAEATVTATADINSKMDQESYSANVLVSNGSFSDTFTLELVVNPDVCDSGKQPTSPNLNIENWELKKNPETDEKDEYYPGDKVVVQNIKIVNDGDKEITDITVEAILYDLDNGDNIESVESDSFTLKKDGDDESIDDLEFYIPTDVDKDDSYAIYLKVYDNGAEDENCNFEPISITIDKRERDMQIDLTSISPQTAKCGDYVDFSVNVENTGSRDDNSVYIKIQDPSLKIFGQSAVFSLDSDDETTKIVRIKLPEDLESKLYSIESVVIYSDSGTTPRSDFGNLTISCETNKAPVANAGTTQSIQTNNIVTLNGAGSTDADNDQLTYLWTQVSGLAVQLSNPTSAVTTFTPTSVDTYVFKLEISDGQEKSSATTSVTVTAPVTTGATTYQPSSAWDVILQKDSLQKATWIVAIVVLVLIAVYLLKLIFNPVKKKPQQPAPEPEFPE